MDSGFRYRASRLIAAMTVPFWTTGCAAVTFDLSDIEEPVMLNALPYAGSSWQATELGEYRSQVSHAAGGAHDPLLRADRGSTIRENDAQMKAFEAIGGHSRRAIVVDKIDAWSGGGNLLFVFVEMSAVHVKGRIVEIGASPSAEGKR